MTIYPNPSVDTPESRAELIEAIAAQRAHYVENLYEGERLPLGLSVDRHVHMSGSYTWVVDFGEVQGIRLWNSTYDFFSIDDEEIAEVVVSGWDPNNDDFYDPQVPGELVARWMLEERDCE